jgi:hypothetical protein
MSEDLFARVVRVSTELQAKERYSLDAQDEFLYDLIKRAGGGTRPDLVLMDDGYEGDDWNRPSVREGLGWVRTGKVKGLAFLDVDRSGREMHGQLGYFKEVRKAGGRLIFGDLGEYRDDAEFQILLNLKLSIGQYQKAKTKALSRMATLRKVRGGEVHCGGHPPYGYRYEPKTKQSPARLVVIVEQARVVVLIYTWYGEGASLRAIARRLIVEGVQAPKSHWNTMTIKKILCNRTYLGIWHYNKTQCVEPEQIRSTGPRHRRRTSKKQRPESEWEGVAVEPIIMQAMFDSAATRMRSNPHTLGGRPSATYRAKGLVWCGLCNSRFCGQPNHGQPRYICSNRRDRVTGEKKCAALSVSAASLDGALLKCIEDVLSDERQLEALVAKHRSELAAGGNTPDIERMRARLEQIRRREEKARVEALKAAEISDADAEAFYDAEVREAHAQRIELQSQLRAKTVVVDFKVDVRAIARAVRDGLKKATPEQQQKLFHGIIRRVSYRDKEADIEFMVPVDDAQYCKEQQPVAGGRWRSALGSALAKEGLFVSF